MRARAAITLLCPGSGAVGSSGGGGSLAFDAAGDQQSGFEQSHHGDQQHHHAEGVRRRREDRGCDRHDEDDVPAELGHVGGTEDAECGQECDNDRDLKADPERGRQLQRERNDLRQPDVRNHAGLSDLSQMAEDVRFLLVADADLAAHQAQLKSKEAQLNRSRELLPGNFISQQDFEALSSEVDALKAQTKADQAAVETARIHRDFCVVRAPVAGRVGVLLVDQGNVVSAGALQPLVRLNSLDPIYADFPIVERDLADVKTLASKARLKVHVTPLGPNQAPREGELLVIDNTVQAGAGTVKLRAIIPNADRGLWPEQFVNVRLTLDTLPGARLVPSDAVKTGQMGAYVYVVTPEMTLDLRVVRTGQTYEDRVVILEGLKAGERVVVGGQIMLAPGIKVMDAEAMPKTPPNAPHEKPKA